MNKILGHLKTVCKHKYYVFNACRKAGIPLRGLMHDISKFSPTEFLESVKYYTGTYSPIDKCKDINGVSMAWLHHRGRNKHHWEYWVDNFDRGITAHKMPYKYTVEMLCDFIGAGKAYMGKEFTYEREFNWWINGKSHNVIMHPDTKLFITEALKKLKNLGENMVLNPSYLKLLYQSITL